MELRPQELASVTVDIPDLFRGLTSPDVKLSNEGAQTTMAMFKSICPDTLWRQA
jgi:hypothetical protein